MAVHNVMLHEWDPIGVSDNEDAQDEYDAYAGTICLMLQERRPAGELFKFLRFVETKHMGLFGNRFRTKRIAKKLYQLSEDLDGPKRAKVEKSTGGLNWHTTFAAGTPTVGANADTTYQAATVNPGVPSPLISPVFNHSHAGGGYR